MTTQRDRIAALLADRRWHCVRELNRVCWRYGARLWELRSLGVTFEKKPCDCRKKMAHGDHWRLA